MFERLRKRSLPGIIIHWYSGPLDLVGEFLELGAYFTIGVEVLRSKRTQALARELPVERLLTETDSPGGWHWMAGELGYPVLLGKVETALAGFRGVEREAESKRGTRNMLGLLYRCGVPWSIDTLPPSLYD